MSCNYSGSWTIVVFVCLAPHISAELALITAVIAAGAAVFMAHRERKRDEMLFSALSKGNAKAKVSEWSIKDEP